MALLSRACAFSFMLILGTGPLYPQDVRASEYQVKAVFLFNFAQFVDWPADAFANADTPLVIGILGEDPFGSVLDRTVSNERLGKRQFQVRRYRSVDDIKHCQILFISRSVGTRTDTIVMSLGNRPILTVSDAEGFAQRGGMIRFVTQRNRIGLQLNLEAVQAAHLTISSKLLRVAEVVTSNGR